MLDLQRAAAARAELKNRLLATFPELDGDEQTLNDTLSGIDDLEETIIAVLRVAIEREAMGEALGALIDKMTARKRRLEDGARSLRAAVLQAMQDAGLPSIKAPDMTVSVGRGKPKIIAVDEALIPDDLCRIRREPNKTEIAKALADGREVPGVTFGNPVPFLTVYRS